MAGAWWQVRVCTISKQEYKKPLKTFNLSTNVHNNPQFIFQYSGSCPPPFKRPTGWKKGICGGRFSKVEVMTLKFLVTDTCWQKRYAGRCWSSAGSAAGERYLGAGGCGRVGHSNGTTRAGLQRPVAFFLFLSNSTPSWRAEGRE